MCRRQPDEAESPQYELHCAGTLAGGRWASNLLFAGTAVQDASSATVRQSWLKLLPKMWHMLQEEGFPKIKGTGYLFGALTSGNYHMVLTEGLNLHRLSFPAAHGSFCTLLSVRGSCRGLPAV